MPWKNFWASAPQACCFIDFCRCCTILDIKGVLHEWYNRLKSPNGRDVTKRAIIDGNSIVSGRNYDTLTSIIAQLLTSWPFGDLGLWVHNVRICLVVVLARTQRGVAGMGPLSVLRRCYPTPPHPTPPHPTPPHPTPPHPTPVMCGDL